MFFLRPIMISTYLVLISLYLFNHYLKNEKKKSLYISGGLLAVSLLLFIIVYTDTLLDAFVISILFGLVAAICYIPCKMAKAYNKYYRLVFIITHLIAFSILGGIRIMILVANPFYFLIPLLGFSTLYVFRQTPNKIIAVRLVCTLILIRALFTFDYEVPFTIRQVDFFNGYSNNISYSKLHDSKAKIKGIEFYNEHFDERMVDVICIYRPDKKAVISIKNSKKKVVRLIYEDGEVRKE
ncbi:hypothetical protein EZV73_10505 [Acidaminobacter sp. JC074]|uniref:hypothetical protein n=1 Tax=Acidaminobacter sp. JC074 TaxID=2530199 RepID=UPI001F0F3CAA|nr:hypothetical protein [Acidaminobacter sp. JC074]MCH4888007.1 hypothetical protein [Acidaminobacter sp. JC074]